MLKRGIGGKCAAARIVRIVHVGAERAGAVVTDEPIVLRRVVKMPGAAHRKDLSWSHGMFPVDLHIDRRRGFLQVDPVTAPITEPGIGNVVHARVGVKLDSRVESFTFSRARVVEVQFSSNEACDTAEAAML